LHSIYDGNCGKIAFGCIAAFIYTASGSAWDLYYSQSADLASRAKSFRKLSGRSSDEINICGICCFIAFVYIHRLYWRFENRQTRLALSIEVASICSLTRFFNTHGDSPKTLARDQRVVRDLACQKLYVCRSLGFSIGDQFMGRGNSAPRHGHGLHNIRSMQTSRVDLAKHSNINFTHT
jgi:hypothetical protein